MLIKLLIFEILFYFWHGYVSHEGITYKSRVPRTSQMTSSLLGHTAAAVRAHNVLCNSYNTRPLLCARITCYVTVITVEINHCSFRRVRFYAYRLYFINVWRVYEWPKTYTWSGTFILKDGRYTFTFIYFCITCIHTHTNVWCWRVRPKEWSPAKVVKILKLVS
jgi:hypothetical protein